MVDNSKVVLEDNNEYLVIDKIEEEDYFYVYLTENTETGKLVIRKEIKEDGKCYLVGLIDETEFRKALLLFLDKNNIDSL